jgi:integrase
MKCCTTQFTTRQANPSLYCSPCDAAAIRLRPIYRAVQEHLRHADIQTTTIYTRLPPQDLQKVVNLFDEKNEGAAR